MHGVKKKQKGKKGPTNKQRDRDALRDLTEEQLFKQIEKLPEYIAEMQRLLVETRQRGREIRDLKQQLQDQRDRNNILSRDLERERAKKADVPVPPPPKPPEKMDRFGPETGIQGSPFNCKKCASKIMIILTSKNLRRAVVSAHGIKGHVVTHRMRNMLETAWGFNANGDYVTIQTDDKQSLPQDTIYEYHKCGGD